MIIHTDIKQKLRDELVEAKSIYIATAMISVQGWNFIQQNISKDTEQYFLIGIDLATEPEVFKEILDNLHINARVYQSNYTFHPKVYLLQKNDNSFTAFVGSSNTTNWGLEKNIEMNFQINNQDECKKLLQWFKEYYRKGYLVTDDFLLSYKNKYTKIKVKDNEIAFEKQNINDEVSKDQGQFFLYNHHKIFEKKYHYMNTSDLKEIRKEVHKKFKELDNIIYPQFATYGFHELHKHHNPREIVSRHFFNRFSGKYIDAIWLHYGKSKAELSKYSSADKSINKPESFINNIRLQVIIHENSLGVWLVLGKNNGGRYDRDHFKNLLQDKHVLKDYFSTIKLLTDYWIEFDGRRTLVNSLNDENDLFNRVQASKIENYFIIGKEIDYLDPSISAQNISNTILEEFKKLYPLYLTMRHY
ncbi:phospholipase D-like domain-containing protein [Chryseobacterium sp. c4a]|uniref:phospholipase D-like domain-containing protein n=1 Tax=Chryseobacterium sp. c4a TaxID=1573582 RepID=UPI00135C389C|nr:phospholipase D-like domain-containing protein [Chryseobacterium sp. c4a]